MGTLKTTNIQTITGSGTLTLGTSGETLALGSGVTSNLLHPAFEAFLSATQSISDNTDTKIQFDSEVIDTDNCYDNSTNYRFTPTVAGKYFVYAKIRLQTNANTSLAHSEVAIRKNNTPLIETRNIQSANYLRADTPTACGIIDMNGTTDYLEVFGNMDSTSGIDGVIGTSAKRHSNFGAYRIGT